MRPDCSPYGAGDYEGFAQASTPPDLGDFLRDLDRSAPRWIRGATDTPARDRRRVVAASVALKRALPTAIAGTGRHLVEWGCSPRATHSPPPAAACGCRRVSVLAARLDRTLIERTFDHVFSWAFPQRLIAIQIRTRPAQPSRARDCGTTDVEAVSGFRHRS